MLLRPGTWWHEAWNLNIIPAIKDGRIKKIFTDKKHNLRPHQLYSGILEENKRYFRVVAWGFTNNAPHVHVELLSRMKEGD
jgi:hypothetical protein